MGKGLEKRKEEGMRGEKNNKESVQGKERGKGWRRRKGIMGTRLGKEVRRVREERGKRRNGERVGS